MILFIYRRCFDLGNEGIVEVRDPEHGVCLESHFKCIHEIAHKYRICPGFDIDIEIIPSKNVVKLKTEFDKWKSGRKKAKSLRRERFLKTLGEKPRIRDYTDGEPQFKIAGGCQGKAPMKFFVKFMELLLQLHHSRETVFMGKRSEARLTIDGWDTFLGMKFNANNGIGWSFLGNTTDFGIEDAVMEYVLKKLMGLCVDKVAAMEFNPIFELYSTLSDTELTYLSQMIKLPVK